MSIRFTRHRQKRITHFTDNGRQNSGRIVSPPNPAFEQALPAALPGEQKAPITIRFIHINC
jgi:hypothetical protein